MIDSVDVEPAPLRLLLGSTRTAQEEETRISDLVHDEDVQDQLLAAYAEQSLTFSPFEG